jgi:regulator of cell morphogenesis and NO signaling
MKTMDRTETLAELVAANPARAIAMERLGLDYCCGGNEHFNAACARSGLDPDAVAEQLDAAPVLDDTHACAEMTTVELLAHLLVSHHGYLHEELPALDALAAKVVDAHGERHPELRHVHELITLLTEDLEPHLMKEERVLFPAIERLIAGAAEFPFGSINNPIRMMGIEHDRAGELLAQLREATDDYAVPADGCASYRSLYERLAFLDHDTRLHIFEENHLLFPKASALEAGSAG